MKRAIFGAALVVLVVGTVVVATHKKDSIANVADYLFFDGPYLSRTLSYSAVVIEPNSKEAEDVIRGVEFEDRHWYRIDLAAAVKEIETNPSVDLTVVSEFREFVEAYRSIVKAYGVARSGLTDDLALDVASLVNRTISSTKRRLNGTTTDGF